MGIETDRTSSVNAPLLASVGSERSTVDPAIGDFMAAFRNGFITVDDLRQRAQNTGRELSDNATAISVNDLRQKQVADATQLLPGQLDLARQGQTQQQRDLDIQSILAPGRAAAATQLSRDQQEQAEDIDKWRAKQIDAQAADTYQKLTGQPAPAYFAVKNTEKPLSLNEWLDHQPGFEDAASRFTVNATGTAEDAAKYDAFKEAEKARRTQEYLDYVWKLKQDVRVPRGTPEYGQELNKRITDAAQKLAFSNANFDIEKAGREANAKAYGEGVGKAAAGPNSEEQDKFINDLQTRINTDVTMKRVQEAQGFLRNAKDTLAKPNPTNSDDLQLLKSVLKLEDPNAVIRQSNIEAIAKITPRIEKIQKMLKGLYSHEGAILSPQDRQQLRQTVDTFQEGFDRDTVSAAAPYKVNADRAGIPLNRVFHSDVIDAINRSSPHTPAAAAPANPQPTKLGDGTVVPVGGTVNQNGLRYRWDGASWNPVTQ